MFKYDKHYDALFNDSEFLEILCEFHSSKWKLKDNKQKFETVQRVVKRYCEIYDVYKVNNMRIEKRNSYSNCGVYMDFDTLIHINARIINECNQYETLDTIFHELRHNFQSRAIAGNINPIEMVNQKQLEAWKLNFLYYPTGRENYINAGGDYDELYHFQPVEEDAHKNAMQLVKKSYSLIEDKLGIDDEFKNYGISNKETIGMYFSDEEQDKKERNIMKGKVYEVFKHNDDDYRIKKRCVQIAKKIMEKDLKDMSLKEISALFSVYVWSSLDDNYKIDLLKEYDKRVNKYKPVKIENVGNIVCKIDNESYSRTDIINILNALFSYEFRQNVNAIVHNKEECDEKLKEELKINLYKENRKYINYIDDDKNFFLYSIQPFAILEGKVIKKQFMEIEEAEKEFYKIDRGNYDSMIDFYDYDKYIPFIENFYRKPFSEIYEGMLEEMKAKINKINKR